MKLRMLKIEDAPLMLEWMHDDSVVHDLNADYASKTISDCEKFIKYSLTTDSDLHMAIVDDLDVYMGTVSLKHIDKSAGNTEFAITVRKSAMGKGFSQYAMTEIIRIAFEDLGLSTVFWCVSEKNKRAVRFYEKMCFKDAVSVPKNMLDTYAAVPDLRWFQVNRERSVE